MFIIKSEGNEAPAREPLFEIDGTVYTIPVTVGAEVALEAMERSRVEPDTAVTAWCVEQVIGKEAWKALRAVKNLPKETVMGIMEICRERVMGGMEDQGKD